jgi:hypothetical protein
MSFTIFVVFSRFLIFSFVNLSLRVTCIMGLRNLIWEASNHLLSSFLKIQVPLPKCSADLDTMLCNLSEMSLFVLFLKCLLPWFVPYYAYWDLKLLNVSFFCISNNRRQCIYKMIIVRHLSGLLRLGYLTHCCN